ncbi:hypothetical protein STENM223S_08707 [Streptomyces tendae]
MRGGWRGCTGGDVSPGRRGGPRPGVRVGRVVGRCAVGRGGRGAGYVARCRPVGRDGCGREETRGPALPGASPTLGFARAGGAPTAHPCRPSGTTARSCAGHGGEGPPGDGDVHPRTAGRGRGGGVRPQRLARQQGPLLWPTDSAPFRGRTPPPRPRTTTEPKALHTPPPNPHRRRRHWPPPQPNPHRPPQAPHPPQPNPHRPPQAPVDNDPPHSTCAVTAQGRCWTRDGRDGVLGVDRCRPAGRRR